jgi:hypothetical protein
MDINLIKRTWFGDRFDGVIEAVRYNRQGNIQWVRAYQRRGPTWSDHVLLGREDLLQQIKSRKRYFTGRRILNQGSEFELGRRVVLTGNGQGEHIVTENSSANNKDRLEGVSAL